MRRYEVMIILDAGLEEDAIRAIVDRATQIVTNRGGTVEKVERWGKRRFAYEIKHKSEGYYAVFNLVAEPGALDDFERSLRLADDVVRHKLIRLPDAEAARRGLVTTGAEAATA